MRLRFDGLVSLGKAWILEDLARSKRFRIVDGDCEIQIFAALEIQSRDSDHLSRHVEQWAAAAAGRDRRRDLQEFAAFLLDCSDSADYAV